LKPYIARKDRWDIYNNLPIHAIQKIANETGYSYQTIWRVLHGVQPDRYDIIQRAELMAAINIWKTRFCKFKSEL